MMYLDPMILALSSPFMRKAPEAIVTQTALHPLTFLPFHLISHHLTARVFPNKRVTYPAHLAFTLVQYTIEHYSAEFPSVASFGPALVLVALSVAPLTYYYAFKRTTGNKSLIWAALAVFLLALPVFKGLELGFPKDTPEEQAAANLDRTHSLWHAVLHTVVLVNGLMVSYGVPWNPTTSRPDELAPASPAHTTRGRHAGFTLDACSPTRDHKGSKPKAA